MMSFMRPLVREGCPSKRKTDVNGKKKNARPLAARLGKKKNAKSLRAHPYGTIA
jgi:hypothetical protein